MTVLSHMGIVVCGRSRRLTWNLLLFGITLSSGVGNDSEHGTWLRHISFMAWHIGFHDRIDVLIGMVDLNESVSIVCELK